MRLEGRAVSRHHAEIQHGASATVLSDLHSTNGVFLNGVGIKRSPVTEGDVVRLGNWIGCFAANGDQNPGHIRELGPGLWGGDAFAVLLERLRDGQSSGLPLTLTGESGTGKRLIARAVHTWNERLGPFCTLNCATISQRQAELELFGPRARGGAARKRHGLVHTCQGGTLLLQEAGELGPALQHRLSRVPDVHLVLTRQPQRGRGPVAKALATRGTLEIELPPLRRRMQEIPALFAHFVSVYSTSDPFAFDAELVEALCLYEWPGNVRELEFLARQLVTLHQGAREVQRQHLPRRILDAVKRSAHASEVPKNDAPKHARSNHAS